ncbi:MAG TPA: hypothetical protein DCR40_01300 [Prolixibacteraceae bacterium]|nr:hypothetical protein [Prolixibacteraceae bacterium]
MCPARLWRVRQAYGTKEWFIIVHSTDLQFLTEHKTKIEATPTFLCRLKACNSTEIQSFLFGYVPKSLFTFLFPVILFLWFHMKPILILNENILYLLCNINQLV